MAYEWMSENADEQLKFLHFVQGRKNSSRNPEIAGHRLWDIANKIDSVYQGEDEIPLTIHKVNDAEKILGMYPDCGVEIVKKTPQSPTNTRASLVRIDMKYFLHTDNEVMEFDSIEAVQKFLQDTRDKYPNDFVGPECFPLERGENDEPMGYDIEAAVRDEVALRRWILEERRRRGRPPLKVQKKTITTTLRQSLYDEVNLWSLTYDKNINTIIEEALDLWLKKNSEERKKTS